MLKLAKLLYSKPAVKFIAIQKYREKAKKNRIRGKMR